MAMLPDGRIVAVESCDQVQNCGYAIDGVEVSDFNTPENFSPPKITSGVKWDYLGKLTTWFQVAPGGYAQVYDPSRGWTQIGEMRGYRRRLSELGLGRANRRQKLAPHRSWWRRLLGR